MPKKGVLILQCSHIIVVKLHTQNISGVILTSEAEGSVGVRTSIQYGSMKIDQLTPLSGHYYAEAMGLPPFTKVKEKTNNTFEIIICAFLKGKTCYRGSVCFGEAKEALHIQLIMHTLPRVKGNVKGKVTAVT